MSAQAMPRKMVDSFTDGPLLHLLEQHRDFKATMVGRQRGLRIAAIALLATYALYVVVTCVVIFIIGPHNDEVLDFFVVLLTFLMLAFTVIFLLCNHILIKRPQVRYAQALAEAHPGLDLDDEDSIQGYVWEREGHPDSFLPRLYSWLLWKSKLMREEQTIMGVGTIVKHALSLAEQVVLDVWGFSDINAEVFEFGSYPFQDTGNLERGIESFRTIGANKAADIWSEALPLFRKVNANAYPADSSEQLEDWEEAELYDQLGDLNEQLYELEDQTHALLYDYVMKHKAEFVSSQASGAGNEDQA